MKRLLAGAMVLTAVAFAAQTGGTTGSGRDIGTLSTGGPDAYGYTWIDSREPGGPAYNWKDISGIGTQLTGLGDDGYVGPLSLGFDFPYYWYTTNKVWLQFNGALSMSTPTGMYHPGQTAYIPNPLPPNDIVVFMGADLDFTIGGKAYFWTNGSDTAIIQVDSVPEWNDPSSYHSAQVILYLDPSDPDNGHILVQYGPQNGDFDNGGQGVHSAIGIENIAGNVGLQFLMNNNPPSNMPFDGLAVLYVRPDTTNYQITDVGLEALWNGYNLGFYLYKPDGSATPRLWAKNVGNQPISTFQALITIKNFAGTTVYADTVDGPPLNPGEVVMITFDPFDLSARPTGTYRLTGELKMTGDMYNGNNKIEDTEFRIVDNSTTYLGWDNDDAQSFSWWIGGANGDAGWGARFPLPCDMRVDSVVAFVGCAKTGNGQVKVALLADNGSGILPRDTIVISNIINIPGGSTISTAKVAVNQTFPMGTILYGGFFQYTDSTGAALEDQGPFSRNALEYTGTWAPYRERDAYDEYIRLYGALLGVEESGKPTAFLLKSAGPVPTRGKAFFSFVVPERGDVSISIYNALGQKIAGRTETFEAGAGTMAFDLSSFSDGVYIYRLGYGSTDLTGKLLITR
ncbi:MAG: T9SS type A sorting domain-containing protein [candidate division WOR-3 bacterium]